MTIGQPLAEARDEGRELLRAASCLFHGLGDQTRLQTLLLPRLEDRRVVDLTHDLGLAQSTVSNHPACLRDCGLVESTAVGRSTRYRLSQSEATENLLAAADRLLPTKGSVASLCVQHRSDRYGTGDAS